jgi:AI-2 transport protein TqsA
LTFAANFIPYLGSIVACSLPILFAFLQMEFGWRPVTAATLLVSLHVLSAYVIEPAMTGKAVDLSPLVILLALSFWWLSWGLIGMVLAVPLTVMIKIILENVAFTRPVAQLLSER